MNATGINELRGELAHTLFNIEDMDVLKKISKYVNRMVKPEKKEEVEYIEKEELLDAIRQGLREVKEARMTGRVMTMPTLKDFIDEL